mmetsp:Transcript_1545/g.5672  ORF Transcript_1545/g.5672 Transcript_1545/m.5672 type:complete len:746 (+) Transcript_1545:37-2274(+)
MKRLFVMLLLILVVVFVGPRAEAFPLLVDGQGNITIRSMSALSMQSTHPIELHTKVHAREGLHVPASSAITFGSENRTSENRLEDREGDAIRLVGHGSAMIQTGQTYVETRDGAIHVVVNKTEVAKATESSFDVNDLKVSGQVTLLGQSRVEVDDLIVSASSKVSMVMLGDGTVMTLELDSSSIRASANLHVDGNVGIGTTAPQSKLHVDGGSFIIGPEGGNKEGGHITFQAASGREPIQMDVYGDPDKDVPDRLRIYTHASHTGAGVDLDGTLSVRDKIQVGVPQEDSQVTLDVLRSFYGNTGTVAKIGGIDNNVDFTGLSVYSKEHGSSVFEVIARDDTKFVVEMSGDVGIGTTDPQAKLHVRAADVLGATAGDRIQVAEFVGNSPHAERLRMELRRHSTTSAADWKSAEFRLQHVVDISEHGFVSFRGLPASRKAVGIGSGTKEVMTVIDDGRVVIDGSVEFINLNSGPYIDLKVHEGVDFDWRIMNVKSDNSLQIRNLAGNSRLRITSDGKLGVGRPDPQATLHVAGDVQVDGKLAIDGIEVFPQSYASVLFCNGRGHRHNGMCSCFAGFYGDDCAWVLIFQQKRPTIDHFESLKFSKNGEDPHSLSFSNLDLLERFRDKDRNVFEFLLQYPEFPQPNFNRWEQSSNPCTSDTVQGFTAVDLAYPFRFGGMKNCSGGFVNTCLINGDQLNYEWWYSLGTTEASSSMWPNESIPGPWVQLADGNYTNTVVQHVILFVRDPTL